jgi:hypothetical protein
MAACDTSSTFAFARQATEPSIVEEQLIAFEHWVEQLVDMVSEVDEVWLRSLTGIVDL